MQKFYCSNIGLSVNKSE